MMGRNNEVGHSRKVIRFDSSNTQPLFFIVTFTTKAGLLIDFFHCIFKFILKHQFPF